MEPAEVRRGRRERLLDVGLDGSVIMHGFGLYGPFGDKGLDEKIRVITYMGFLEHYRLPDERVTSD